MLKGGLGAILCEVVMPCNMAVKSAHVLAEAPFRMANNPHFDFNFDWRKFGHPIFSQVSEAVLTDIDDEHLL
jgi:hypothetical protein